MPRAAPAICRTAGLPGARRGRGPGHGGGRGALLAGASTVTGTPSACERPERPGASPRPSGPDRVGRRRWSLRRRRNRTRRRAARQPGHVHGRGTGRAPEQHGSARSRPTSPVRWRPATSSAAWAKLAYGAVLAAPRSATCRSPRSWRSAVPAAAARTGAPGSRQAPVPPAPAGRVRRRRPARLARPAGAVQPGLGQDAHRGRPGLAIRHRPAEVPAVLGEPAARCRRRRPAPGHRAGPALCSRRTSTCSRPMSGPNGWAAR